MIKEGDNIILISERLNRWLVKVQSGKEFQTHKGIIKFDDIIGKDYGFVLESSIGKKFYVLEPLIYDYIFKSKRSTQIIYPKDAAIITLFSGIHPGSRIIEAGIGSGALTIALANIIRPNGKIYAYEIKEEYIPVAKKNLERAGLAKFVEIKHRDALNGFDETDVDNIILDLATPWLIIPIAYKALKNSGVILSYSPTIDQVQKTVNIMKENNFIDIHTIECLIREWQIAPNKVRPHMRMIGHTGFMTFGTKIFVT
ncbi:MAG: tRNA (adenine-N1)-methyltransferase [Candidatus Helarchaeota archaeon]|nr:tRNA (adenine-N1)-methyltransferase [Candidatus Helarchaeota archaeon]